MSRHYECRHVLSCFLSLRKISKKKTPKPKGWQIRGLSLLSSSPCGEPGWPSSLLCLLLECVSFHIASATPWLATPVALLFPFFFFYRLCSQGQNKNKENHGFSVYEAGMSTNYRSVPIKLGNTVAAHQQRFRRKNPSDHKSHMVWDTERAEHVTGSCSSVQLKEKLGHFPFPLASLLTMSTLSSRVSHSCFANSSTDVIEEGESLGNNKKAVLPLPPLEPFRIFWKSSFLNLSRSSNNYSVPILAPVKAKFVRARKIFE